MKICPKCKRLHEDAWQVCGECHKDLVHYRRPFYKAAVKTSILLLLNIVALVPVVSAFLLRINADKMTPALKERLLFLSNPAFVFMGIVALLISVVLILINIVMLILAETIHPDILDQERDGRAATGP